MNTSAQNETVGDTPTASAVAASENGDIESCVDNPMNSDPDLGRNPAHPPGYPFVTFSLDDPRWSKAPMRTYVKGCRAIFSFVNVYERLPCYAKIVCGLPGTLIAIFLLEICFAVGFPFVMIEVFSVCGSACFSEGANENLSKFRVREVCHILLGIPSFPFFLLIIYILAFVEVLTLGYASFYKTLLMDFPCGIVQAIDNLTCRVLVDWFVYVPIYWALFPMAGAYCCFYAIY